MKWEEAVLTVELEKMLSDLLKHHSYNENMKRTITKAFKFAVKAHEGTERKSGEPYVYHPIAVAMILDAMKADYETICAALLHDTIEDVEEVDEVLIAKEFSTTIAHLVDGVTKVSSNNNDKTEGFKLTVNKLMLSLLDDPRIFIIKLADRLHNIKTIYGHSRQSKRDDICNQTLEVFVPLAGLLSMYDIKEELEELCFKQLHDGIEMDPKNKHDRLYEDIQLEKRIRYEKDEKLAQFIFDAKNKIIPQILSSNGIKLNVDKSKNIEFKSKSCYQINEDLVNNGYANMSQINNLLKFRINLKDVPNCYAAFGAINSQYTPLGNEIYINNPAFNGYEAIHARNEVKLAFDYSRIFQFEYRTFDMKNRANNGIASCWNYDNDYANGEMSAFLEKLPFYTDLKNLCNKYKSGDINDDQLYEELKAKIFAKRIIINIGENQIMQIYENCTVEDLIKKLHPGFIDENAKYIVNREEQSLNYQLKQNDIFEELLSQQSNYPQRVLSKRGDIKTRRDI